MPQIAEGALNETSSLLIRMGELAIQAANGTLGDTERATVDLEFQGLLCEIDRIAEVTEFNANQLIKSTGVTVFQIGPRNTVNDRLESAIRSIAIAVKNTKAADLRSG